MNTQQLTGPKNKQQLGSEIGPNTNFMWAGGLRPLSNPGRQNFSDVPI